MKIITVMKQNSQTLIIIKFDKIVEIIVKRIETKKIEKET